MTPFAIQRETGLAEDGSDVNHEQPALLGIEDVRSPLSAEEEDEDHTREVSSWKKIPWWKRPSPYWLIFGTLFSSMGFAALLGPKMSLYTTLACRVHRPGYAVDTSSSLLFPLVPSLVSIDATTTPVSYFFINNSEPAVGTVSALLPTPPLVYAPDSDPEQKCASDPVVQAVVAKLNAVFTASMGILSCITAGWWGSLSDRYGRRIVLFVSLFGLFVTEFTHIITAWFVDALPGGYWFPLVGFLFEGLCGSMPSGVAVLHACLADTTDPSTRSRYFSLGLGLTFTGVAIGPALGGLLIRLTGTILSAFYFATVLHGIYIIFILFILPEPLTRARARGARLRCVQEKMNQTPGSRVSDILKSATGFLQPLVVLLPEQSSNANPLKPSEKDWSLSFISLAYALVTSALGAFPYKFQYAAAKFNWTPEIISYYVSVVGATRAIFLTVILPLVIRYFKPSPIQLPTIPDEPLRGTVGSPSRGSAPLPDSPEANAPRPLPTSGSSAFDLALARGSVGLEAKISLSMAVASTGTLFAAASVIGSFAAGSSPALQALALDIYTNRHAQNRGEVGKLFGALGVIQGLGSQIISPVLYGFVYFNTVGKFPQAIMVVSLCTSLLAFTFLSLVRIPSKPIGDGVSPEQENEGSQGTVTPGLLPALGDEVIHRR